MSLFYCMQSGSLLEIVSEILDMAEQLHTASFEYTVMREKNVPIGLDIHIQCFLAEQKAPALVSLSKNHVEKMNKDIKNSIVRI